MPVAIVGGGIYGLCVAFSLIKRGYKNIHLFEQHSWPNTYGSSHGDTRITRSTYSDAFYVQLMQKAHHVYWPTLEKTLRSELRIPCDGIFFGPQNGRMQQYAQAIQDVKQVVTPLSPSQAAQRFPQFSFFHDDLILFDHSAAVITAKRSISKLHAYLLEHDVVIHSHTRVQHITQEKIYTDKGIFDFDCFFITAGSWTGTLLPFLSDVLTPIRQQVFYVEPNKEKSYEAPHFPVWVEVGMTLAENWYGLPQFGRAGLKVARHRLLGVQSDPDQPSVILESHREELRATCLRRFKKTTGNILHEESCIYTMRQKEHLLIDRHPQWDNMIIASGGSGHGFKLAPLCADLMVDILEGGETPTQFRIHS